MAKKSAQDDNEFPSKWKKFLPDNYTDTADALSTEELNKEIIKAEGVVSDLESDMENDAKLKVLKEDLKALAGGYGDEIKTEKAKIKYDLYLLRARGVR